MNAAKTNHISLSFDAISENEAFARMTAAMFMAQLNPTLDDVEDVKTAVAEAKKQVEQDKKDIDDTIQNSLLASAEKILESVQDYFNRAEALYSSMYLDCDGETPYLRTVTPIFIDGATPQVRNANEGVDFDGGTPTSRQLAV